MNITNFNVIAIGRNIMCRIQSSCWWRSRRAVLRKTRLVASCARRSTAICLIASRSRREEQQCYATALIGITLFLLGLRHRQGEKTQQHIILIIIILAPPAAAPPVCGSFARFFPGSAFCIVHRFAFSSTDLFFIFFVFFSLLDRTAGRSISSTSSSCSWKAIRTERVSTGIFLLNK